LPDFASRRAKKERVSGRCVEPVLSKIARLFETLQYASRGIRRSHQMNPTQVINFVEELEAEVNNGGFHQYFNNSSGDNTAEAIEALEIIGASAAANLLRQAAAMFPGNMPLKNREKRLEILMDKFPDTDEFDDLDNEFYAYPDAGESNECVQAPIR
jgi:hypothetical protein